MREEMFDGNTHEAALIRLAIKEEFTELKELREEIKNAKHPAKIQDNFIREDLKRKAFERSREVSVGYGTTTYSRG